MINDDDRYTPTEFALRHRPARPDTKKVFRRATPSPERQTKERNERRYTGRSNICPKHFVARPCECDE